MGGRGEWREVNESEYADRSTTLAAYSALPSPRALAFLAKAKFPAPLSGRDFDLHRKAFLTWLMNIAVPNGPQDPKGDPGRNGG